MADEWGPWIEHDGKGVPAPVGTWVHVKSLILEAEGRIGSRGAGDWTWVVPNPVTSIIRYRIRKPKGLTILECLIADIPAPTKPTVDA